MRNLLFLFFIGTGLASCSEDFFSQTLDIEQPDYEKQLVLHGFAGNLDSVFRISLTRNYGILEDVPTNGGWAVTGAAVELYEDGQKVATLAPSATQEDLYETLIQPGFFQPGKAYELRAIHPDYPAVTGRQVMPQPVQVDSARFRENGGINGDGDKLSAIDVFLKDTPGQEDFYEIRVTSLYPIIEYKYDLNGNPFIDTIGYQEYVVSPEGSDDPNAQLIYGGGIAISDRVFDGESYRFVVQIYYQSSGSTYQVRVRAITEEYYLYGVSAQRKYDTEDFPLAEPVTTFDNIENGIGAFGLVHEQVFEVE